MHFNAIVLLSVCSVSTADHRPTPSPAYCTAMSEIMPVEIDEMLACHLTMLNPWIDQTAQVRRVFKHSGERYNGDTGDSCFTITEAIHITLAWAGPTEYGSYVVCPTQTPTQTPTQAPSPPSPPPPPPPPPPPIYEPGSVSPSNRLSPF